MAPSLVQAQLSCTPDEKDAFLLLLLRTRLANGRTILFANAITALQRLKTLLTLLEVPALVLQGGMQQRARLKALERFREGGEHASVLLATDVAARGLDIEGVEYVVHYQLPRSAEVYVHRSGRTARAAASGLSIALIEPADHKTYALSTAHTHSMRVLTTARPTAHPQHASAHHGAVPSPSFPTGTGGCATSWACRKVCPSSRSRRRCCRGCARLSRSRANSTRYVDCH